MLKFLRSLPYVDELKDQTLIQKQYKYWRLRIFLSMYIGYAFYYFGRKGFTFAMPMMQSQLGLEKFELGLLASIFSIAYGTSKFVSGIQADRSNPRYFMSIGLILTGVCNLLFGMSSILWLFALFWGINGWFQGWGWPASAKLLTHWYSQSERGRWWSVWNTAHNLGGAVIPLIAFYFVANAENWRYAMLIPGFLCVFVGLALIFCLRDTPQSMGLPSIEKFRGDEMSKKAEETSLSSWQMLCEYILRNRYIWLLSFAYFFIYIIRMAVNEWSMLYLIETKGFSNLAAGFCICWFEIGGFFGSLVAGWGSDLLFKGKRNPINILFSLAMLPLLLAFQTFPSITPLLGSLFLFFFGFFIFGPQMLIGMAAAELSHKKAAATATGFAGSFAYFGAAVAGAPFGAIAKHWGWDGFFSALILCAAIAACLLLPLWSVKTNPKEKRELA